jgi:preprotein translocase subunit SecG
VILTVGFQVAGHNAFFGILPHFVPLFIGFILMIIGAGALTGLTSNISCGNPDQTFPRCSTMKSLVAVTWIDAIFLLIMLIFVGALAFKARAWGGVRRNTLYID